MSTDCGAFVIVEATLRADKEGCGTLPIFKRVDHELAGATEQALKGRRVRDPIWSRVLDRSMITVHPLGVVRGVADSGEHLFQ